MLQPKFAVYLGKEKDNGFAGFIAEENFFLVLEVEEGMGNKEGQEIIQKIKDDLKLLSANNLASFDQFISNLITKYNFPASFSISSGYLRKDVFYLKTVGEGKIFLKRGNDFARVIEKENSASGYIENNDFYIFTSVRLINLLGSDLELKTIFDHKDPQRIVEELTPQFKTKDDYGIATLFLQFQLKREEEGQDDYFETGDQEDKTPQPVIKDKLKAFIERFQRLSQSSGSKKIYTFIAVIIIFFILVWSLILGDKRRSEAEINKKIKSTKEMVEVKLKQAEEEGFLNLSRSLTLISEAKDEIEKLREEIGDTRKEVGEIENSVKRAENKIVKKEEKTFEEFYDLTLDNKGAKGDKMYLDKDSLSIIDKGKGIIYSLSLSKKSIEKKTSTKVKKADFLTAYNEEVLFYIKSDGIYKFSSDNKANKVIDKDADWAEIVDMWIYNGNIYLLDSGSGDIYKYLVAEGGYSEKSSYLKGEAGSVKGANSMAIDASIYVGFEDYILKYTAGAQDAFSTSWPEKNVKLTKIFTTAELEKVYGWDRNKSAIYVLGKNGTYERQIVSSILNRASDLAVFKNSAYLLVGEKIYEVKLD